MFNKNFQLFSSLILLLLFFVFILEVAVRLVVKKPYEERLEECTEYSYEPYEQSDQCYHSQEEIAKMEYDTFAGYVPASNSSGVGWHTNNDHFRYSENFTLQKPEGEFRIFITGGSTAWGAGVQQEQTFSHLLEKKLNQNYPQKKFRVIIAAAGAWASSQEKVFINNYIADFSPDLIIMFSGWNDVYHAYTGKDYNKDQDFLMYRKAIAAYQDFIKIEGRLAHQKHDKFFNISPPQYNEYNSKLWYLLNKILYNFSTNQADIIQELAHIQLTSDKIVKNTLENIDLVYFLSKKYNFDLVYCLQPSIYNTQKTLSNWENDILYNSRKYYVNYEKYNALNYEQLRLTIHNDSVDKGYLFIDADEAIKDEKNTLFVDHVHFGDRGNRIIAEYLYNIITNLLPAN